MGLLTLDLFKKNASEYVQEMSKQGIGDLYGVTDGKAVGTYIEHAFHEYLESKGYDYKRGSSASGIDFPLLGVDMKVTSIKQPQSSCPFKEASQKVYGLGYHLLVLVYDKTDDSKRKRAHLSFEHAIFVEDKHTADYQTTTGILGILARNANKDDIIAFLEERNLYLDEMGREKLAEKILRDPPEQGYLTISNALQWRLQYSRAVQLAQKGDVEGVENLLK